MSDFTPDTIDLDADGSQLTFHKQWTIECSNCDQRYTVEVNPDDESPICPNCDADTSSSQRTKSQSFTQHIEYEGVKHEPTFRLIHECEHEDCGYQWQTKSDARRPTCPGCQRKTDRNIVGGYYENYMKFSLFTGEERTGDEVVESLRYYANMYEAMLANGWSLADTTQSSHVVLVSGNVNPDQFEIIA